MSKKRPETTYKEQETTWNDLQGLEKTCNEQATTWETTYNKKETTWNNPQVRHNL